jgi:protein phosphatase
VYQTTTIDVDDLPTFQQETVEATINADNLRDAIDIVNRLDELAGG